MKLPLFRHIRLAGVTVLWIGIFIKSWNLFGLGLLLFTGTYLYTIAKLEEKFLFPKDEDKDDL
jgi:hypothetical protein